jgi:histidinol-phosphate aminotransferase
MTEPDWLYALARREVRNMASYNAGLSSEAVRQRFALERIAKLGSNENHFGPSSRVIAAVTREAQHVGLYPDPECTELRLALAARLGVEGARLIFGNGSEDLLGIISRVFLDHGDQVVTVLPSFGLHLLYPEAVGAEVIGVPMTAQLQIDVDGLLAALTPRTRLLMFACPSNPVGCALNEQQLQSILDTLGPQTLLVFDEAYFEYACHAPGYPDCLALLEASGKPYILLRTFSKAYALAGLRVGYGVASDVVLANLVDRLRTPFNLNRCAQAAAVAALDDEEHLEQTLRHVASERERLFNALQALGVRPVPSLANFLFFATPFAAESVNQQLLARGVIVKPWREAGYTEYLRVSIGSAEDNQWFLEQLEASLAVLHGMRD